MARLSLFLPLLLLAALLLVGCSNPSPIRDGVDAQGVPYRGAASALVTVYEYSDFQCPNCKLTQPALHDFLSDYQGKGVRLVYKFFPLEEIHPNAREAAVAAVCAGKQGKFWPYHDKLFENQERLDAASLMQYAKESGLETVAFAACTSGAPAKATVDADTADALSRGIQGTPSFVIGDLTLRGAQTRERLAQAADRALGKTQ